MDRKNVLVQRLYGKGLWSCRTQQSAANVVVPPTKRFCHTALLPEWLCLTQRGGGPVSVQELEVPEAADVPVVVCIAPDAGDRQRVLKAMERLDVVVVVAPDGRSARQLLGRAEALEPDPHREEARVVTSGDLEINLDCAEARWRGDAVQLTQRELVLLARLAREPGRVWPFGRLHEAVWGSRYLGDPSSLHAAVKRLRRKLREAGAGVRLDAVRGVGFRLKQP